MQGLALQGQGHMFRWRHIYPSLDQPPSQLLGVQVEPEPRKSPGGTRRSRGGTGGWGWGLGESVTHHMCGYLAHTYMSRICTPPPFNSTTHKDAHRDVSRSQDRDSLHWATCMCPLKVTARHTMPPTLGQDITAKIKCPCSWLGGLGAGPRALAKAGRTGMRWTRDLTREGWVVLRRRAEGAG